MDPADAKYPNDTRNNLAVVSLFQPNGYVACIKKSITKVLFGWFTLAFETWICKYENVHFVLKIILSELPQYNTRF